MSKPFFPPLYLAEDLQFLLLFLIGSQSCKLLEEHGARWGGDVQEVLEGMVDGAGRDAGLVGPVTDYTCRREEGSTGTHLTCGETFIQLTQLEGS